MMYGKFNPDIFCRVIEQILSERDENTTFKVKLVSKEEADEIKKQMYKEVNTDSTSQ